MAPMALCSTWPSACAATCQASRRTGAPTRPATSPPGPPATCHKSHTSSRTSQASSHKSNATSHTSQASLSSHKPQANGHSEWALHALAHPRGGQCQSPAARHRPHATSHKSQAARHLSQVTSHQTHCHSYSPFRRHAGGQPGATAVQDGRLGGVLSGAPVTNRDPGSSCSPQCTPGAPEALLGTQRAARAAAAATFAAVGLFFSCPNPSWALASRELTALVASCVPYDEVRIRKSTVAMRQCDGTVLDCIQYGCSVYDTCVVQRECHRFL